MPKSDLEVEFICQNKNGCWNFKSSKISFVIIVNWLMLRTVKITS